MMQFSPTDPKLIQCFQADVDVTGALLSQPGPTGQRNVYPIVGGRFTGTIAPETDSPRSFAGDILPGGFDMQRVRSDELKELEAIYHLRTDDGVFLEVRNRALVIYGPDGRQHYSRSRIHFEAPTGGPYSWLNERVIVGTTEVGDWQDNRVVVRVRGFAVV